jgi:hypothetical protein
MVYSLNKILKDNPQNFSIRSWLNKLTHPYTVRLLS